jgi:DNA-binding XRE family transcriptional regulator
MRTLEEIIASLPPSDQARIAAKAKRLIRAETLRQLRAAAKKTQEEVAAATGMAQHNVSRLERRDDMLLSTLQTYVGGLGGRLRLLAEFPSQEPIELDFSGRPAPTATKRAAGRGRTRPSSGRTSRPTAT